MVVEGPTAEEMKHKELALAAAKAWEEVTAIGKTETASGMKIKETLSLGPE